MSVILLALQVYAVYFIVCVIAFGIFLMNEISHNKDKGDRG